MWQFFSLFDTSFFWIIFQLLYIKTRAFRRKISGKLTFSIKTKSYINDCTIIQSSICKKKQLNNFFLRNWKLCCIYLAWYGKNIYWENWYNGILLAKRSLCFLRVTHPSVNIVKDSILTCLTIHYFHAPAVRGMKKTYKIFLEIFFGFVIHYAGKYFYNESFQKVLEQISFFFTTYLDKLDQYLTYIHVYYIFLRVPMINFRIKYCYI